MQAAALGGAAGGDCAHEGDGGAAAVVVLLLLFARLLQQLRRHGLGAPAPTAARLNATRKEFCIQTRGTEASTEAI